jgi:hypothetical protein
VTSYLSVLFSPLRHQTPKGFYLRLCTRCTSLDIFGMPHRGEAGRLHPVKLLRHSVKRLTIGAQASPP